MLRKPHRDRGGQDQRPRTRHCPCHRRALQCVAILGDKRTQEPERSQAEQQTHVGEKTRSNPAEIEQVERHGDRETDDHAKLDSPQSALDRERDERAVKQVIEHLIGDAP